MKNLYNTHMQYPASASGFTLIEVLVAMLITAIGIMGIAALQFKGLQYNQDAYYRTQINFLAYDIADRMRLNQKNASTYVMANAYEVPADKPAGCKQTGTNAVGKSNDMACWKEQLWESLPPGSTAQIADSGNGLFTVTLAWVDRENPGNLKTLDYTFQP